MEHSYKIEGMHCPSCVNKISKELNSMPGVESAEVTLNPPEAHVRMRDHIDIDKLNSVIKNAGQYSLHELNGYRAIESQYGGSSTQSGSKLTTYKPLILILLFLSGFVVLNQVSNRSFDLMDMMNKFMGGFFIIFSFFKLLNLKGFAEAYSTYDIIAKKWEGYGYIYPYIELSLGIAYLMHFEPLAVNIVTALIMGISTIGVLQSVLDKTQIKCACLGTVFNLPMSTITLVEDLLMVVMALAMILIII